MDRTSGILKEKSRMPKRVYELAVSYTVIAFLGWCFEKVGRFLVYGSIADRGFLSLPLCPIYATSVVGAYLFFGTPRRLRILGKPISVGVIKSIILYFILSSVLASAVELAVGLFFEAALDIRLWDYSERALNFFGHICLSYSFLWGAALTLFMATVWQGLEAWVKRIHRKKLAAASIVICVTVAADLSFNLFYLFFSGSHFNFL